MRSILNVELQAENVAFMQNIAAEKAFCSGKSYLSLSYYPKTTVLLA